MFPRGESGCGQGIRAPAHHELLNLLNSKIAAILYFGFRSMRSRPFMYFLRASGMLTLPSAFW
jgi:hypothetical protein